MSLECLSNVTQNWFRLLRISPPSGVFPKERDGGCFYHVRRKDVKEL